jgi:hypothetical protein
MTSTFQKLKSIATDFIPALMSITTLILLLSDYYANINDAKGLQYGYADKYTETQPLIRAQLNEIGPCALKDKCLEWNCPCMLNVSNCGTDRVGKSGKFEPYDKTTGARSGCVALFSHCAADYCPQCTTFRKFAARLQLESTAYLMFRSFLYALVASYLISCFVIWKWFRIVWHIPIFGGMVRAFHFYNKIFRNNEDQNVTKEIAKFDLLVNMWQSISLDLPNIVIKLYIYALTEGLPTAFNPVNCEQILDWRFLTFLYSMKGFCTTIVQFIIARWFPSSNGESIIVTASSSDSSQLDNRFVRYTTYLFLFTTVLSFIIFIAYFLGEKAKQLEACESLNKNTYTSCASV